MSCLSLQDANNGMVGSYRSGDLAYVQTVPRPWQFSRFRGSHGNACVRFLTLASLAWDCIGVAAVIAASRPSWFEAAASRQPGLIMEGTGAARHDTSDLRARRPVWRLLRHVRGKYEELLGNRRNILYGSLATPNKPCQASSSRARGRRKPPLISYLTEMSQCYRYYDCASWAAYAVELNAWMS